MTFKKLQPNPQAKKTIAMMAIIIEMKKFLVIIDIIPKIRNNIPAIARNNIVNPMRIFCFLLSLFQASRNSNIINRQ